MKRSEQTFLNVHIVIHTCTLHVVPCVFIVFVFIAAGFLLWLFFIALFYCGGWCLCTETHA